MHDFRVCVYTCRFRSKDSIRDSSSFFFQIYPRVGEGLKGLNIGREVVCFNVLLKVARSFWNILCMPGLYNFMSVLNYM